MAQSPQSGGAELARIGTFGQLAGGLLGVGDWQRWGPYVSERQWGTVREDYSADGDAWAYFPHDHARSRAYRWGEDMRFADEGREGAAPYEVLLHAAMIGDTTPIHTAGRCGRSVAHHAGPAHRSPSGPPVRARLLRAPRGRHAGARPQQLARAVDGRTLKHQAPFVHRQVGSVRAGDATQDATRDATTAVAPGGPGTTAVARDQS